MLYQLEDRFGSYLQFEIAPMNIHQLERNGATEFAEKPVLGRRPPLEYVGEGAEELTLQGRLFPETLGGLTAWDALEQRRKSGEAQHLMRGDGRPMGWFVLTTVQETSTYLNAQGVGRQIEWSLGLKATDAPKLTGVR